MKTLNSKWKLLTFNNRPYLSIIIKASVEYDSTLRVVDHFRFLLNINAFCAMTTLVNCNLAKSIGFEASSLFSQNSLWSRNDQYGNYQI